MIRLPYQLTQYGRMFLFTGISGAVLLTASGCTKPEPKSAIVEAVQQAGAGPVSPATSSAALEDWFRKHRQTAESIDGQCKPIREKATAEWSESTEGRVCQAARTVAAFTYKPVDSDHKTFESGWK